MNATFDPSASRAVLCTVTLPSGQPGERLPRRRRSPDIATSPARPYSNGTSLLRCIAALLMGATATALVLMTLNRHYRPLRLSDAPTVKNGHVRADDSRILVFESTSDIPFALMERSAAPPDSFFLATTGSIHSSGTKQVVP